MKCMKINLDEEEENIIREFKELEGLSSKEKAIKLSISKLPKFIPELEERIKSREKYKKKQK